MNALPQLPAGFRLHAHDRLPSTSDEARRLAEAGEPHGAVVWARVQTRGRGRHGRDWASPDGNLYVSYLLRPAVAAARAPQLGFVVALALAETARTVLPEDADIRCKWPNDLLVDGRKAAGILLESALGPDGQLDWLIAGCGVNRVSHPADTRWPATDLEREGARGASLEALLSTLTRQIDHHLGLWRREGFATIRRAWEDRAYALGRAIAIATGEEAATGRFAGIGDHGELLLDTAAGRRIFRHGDVSLREPVPGEP